MNRVIVIGCPGSGKTTLAKALADKTDLPLVHLDKIQWQGDWQCIRGKDFDRILSQELQKPQWIIDGNYNRTIPLRLRYCDTVIYLDYPTVVSIRGAFKRVISNYGRVRDDMGGNCKEKFDPSFFWFIATFNLKNRKKYHHMLKDCSDKNIVILKNRRDADDFIANIKGAD